MTSFACGMVQQKTGQLHHLLSFSKNMTASPEACFVIIYEILDKTDHHESHLPSSQLGMALCPRRRPLISRTDTVHQYLTVGRGDNLHS